MQSATIKQIDSYLASIKSALLTELSDDEALLFLKWQQDKLLETIRDRKDKEIFSQIKQLDPTVDSAAIASLKAKRKKYLPQHYPNVLAIGDIVHINFGFGFCNELSDGHYGIILSNMVANMYLILPLSSKPLRAKPVSLSNLGIPHAQGTQGTKLSYLRFDQLRFVHYRRIKKIYGVPSGVVKLSQVNMKFVYDSLNEFLNFPVDNS